MSSDSETEQGPAPTNPTMQPATISPYPVCRLTDYNYAAWSLKTEMALKRESLWRFIEDPPAVLRGEDRHLDERAQALIILSMDDDLLVHVRGLRTAKECWDALKEIYVRESVASKITLSRRLYRARLEPGDNLREHLRAMQQTFKELHEKGVQIPEFQKSLTVLSSLDSSWDTFALTLETVPETTLTLSYLTGRLLEEEEKRKENALIRGKRPSTSKALTKSTAEEGSAQIHAARRCFKCGGLNHIARTCKARQPRKQGKASAEAVKYLAAVAQTCDVDHNSWLIDSGSSQHICCVPRLFSSLQPSKKEHVRLANGQHVPVQGVGEIYVPMLRVKLRNVLCVPGLKQNLLSVACLVQAGFTVSFYNNTCYIRKRGNLCVKSVMHDNVFMLGNSIKEESKVMCTNDDIHRSCQHLWHRRLGHLNYRYIQKTASIARGMPIKDCKSFIDCDPCKQSKSKKAPVKKKSLRQSERIFALVHADLVGPVRPSVGGAKYIFLITDDYSRYSYCYLLKHKSEVFEHFKQWVNMVERRFGQKVAQLQTDRGGEFLNNMMSEWLKRKGIMHRKTNPYSAAENGVAERRGGWIQTIKDALMADSGLSPVFWGEAILTAVFLSNRVWSESVKDIPYRLLYNKAPDLSYLRCFGTKAWVHVESQRRRKGQAKAQQLTFVGYEPLTKGYRFLAPDKRHIIVSRSAKFCEHEHMQRYTQIYLPSPREFPREDRSQASPKQSRAEEGGESESKGLEQTELTPSRQPEPVKEEAISPDEQSSPIPVRTFNRSTRGIPPERLIVGEVRADFSLVEPESYEDVLKLPRYEREKWFRAMEEEMRAMERLNVFTVCELPAGSKAVGSRWVYRIKSQGDGVEPIYRARLVAQGFTQVKYTDYTDVYSPTVTAPSIRLLLTLAAHYKWKVHHYDVITAFLNAKLTESIYMCQAPGFDKEGKIPKVYRLNKAIYGLKQAAREWNKCLNKVLENIGFKATKADPCVYTKGVGSSQIIVVCYVDDLILTGLNNKQIETVAQQLEEAFQLKYLGEITNYLGIEIQRVPEGFNLSQTAKIRQLLDKWGMKECKPVQTPMVLGVQTVEGEEMNPCNVHDFKSLLGSLQHIALWTRPDISHAVNVLSRQACKPTLKDWMSLKRVLRYLQGSADLKLAIQPEGPLWLRCFADSDWAGSDDRKSTSGIAIKCANVLVAWKSKKQSHLSLSSCESEYSAVSELITELIWFRQYLHDLGIEEQGTIVVYEDNQACIDLASSDRVKSRSKHIDIRYQNVKTAVLEGLIELHYCPSEQNCADILTKALTRAKHEKGVELLGLVSDKGTDEVYL